MYHSNFYLEIDHKLFNLTLHHMSREMLHFNIFTFKETRFTMSKIHIKQD